MKINPSIAASAISRYENAIRRKEAQPQAMPAATDRLELSDRARLYTEMIQAAGTAEDVSEERITAVMNRIASGSYRIDADQLAGRILGLAEETPAGGRIRIE